MAFKLVSNTPLEWVFESTSQQSPEAPILTPDFRVTLPPQASGARLDSPRSAFQELVYQMPEPPTSNGFFLWGGILAMGTGLVLGILGFVFCGHRPPLSPPPAPQKQQ
jgi:hypothetical protein